VDIYLYARFFLAMKHHGYHRIYNSTFPSLLSEWIFSPVPFKKGGGGMARIREFAASLGMQADDFLRMKDEIAPAFIEEMARGYDWGRFAAVCFTLSYAQLNASFALAGKIKEKFPRAAMVFGGALSQIHENSIPQYMKAYPFIDYFVMGEAEPVIVPLARHAVSGEEGPPPEMQGLYYRHNGQVCHTGGISRLDRMEKAPIPDYQGYFAMRQKLPAGERFHFKKQIPIEFSKGCPWGQKKPCTFCGFYPCRDYRPKTAEKITGEMAKQAARYGTDTFYVVDAGVDAGLIEEAFPRFRELAGKVSIPFIETRTSLKEKHIKIMKDAGVSMIQPGIECLDGSLLRKVNKGVSLFNNLLFMKWCRKHGIRLSYNIILNIPDALPGELKNQLRIMKKLLHLDPPYTVFLSLVRFSGYWENWQNYPITEPRPDPFYAHIHPPQVSIADVAFEFTADYTMDFSPYVPIYRDTAAFIQKWRGRWAAMPPFLMATSRKDGSLLIEDGRQTPINPAMTLLDGPRADIYRLCMDRPQSPASIQRRLQEKHPGIDAPMIQRTLDSLAGLDLVLNDKKLYLSLAVENT
jgi:ribosomal peptide maturation radical SAM protein 1